MCWKDAEYMMRFKKIIGFAPLRAHSKDANQQFLLQTEYLIVERWCSAQVVSKTAIATHNKRLW